MWAEFKIVKGDEVWVPCLCGAYRNRDKACQNKNCCNYMLYTLGMRERGVSPKDAGANDPPVSES